MFVDAHAHLDFKEFAHDLPAVVEAAQRCQVLAILTCGTDLTSSRAALAIAERFPCVYAACGVHPNHSENTTDSDLREIESLLAHPRAVAVGEIGLDFHANAVPAETQRRVFGEMLGMAKRLGKPVAVHSRAAEEECLKSVLDKGLPRALFHCFTGRLETGRAIQQAGYLVGVTGIITFSNPSNADLVSGLNPFGLLTETDSPFLGPAPFRGKRNDPSRIPLIVNTLRERFPDVDEARLRRSLLDNFAKLFGVTI